MASGKVLRAGSATKRTAILTAARDLFLADGFDRTSVDAVAARAAVSKRTVYDYFGDKQALLQAVVDMSGQAMLATIERSLEETVAQVASPADLEAALIDFCMRIATEMLNSAEYTVLSRLALNDAENAAHLDRELVRSAPEEAVAVHLRALSERGLLGDLEDARLAADHLVALTFMVAMNRLGWTTTPHDDRMRDLVIAGVRAFLRAYRPSPEVDPGGHPS